MTRNEEPLRHDKYDSVKTRFYDSMKYEHKPHYFWCAFAMAVPQCCRGRSLAPFAVVSRSGHSSRSSSEALREAVHMSVHVLAEPRSDDKPALLLASEPGGPQRDGDSEGCCRL